MNQIDLHKDIFCIKRIKKEAQTTARYISWEWANGFWMSFREGQAALTRKQLKVDHQSWDSSPWLQEILEQSFSLALSGLIGAAKLWGT